MIRSFFAYFVLLFFLFPAIEQGIHAFEHEEEEHCTAHEQTHFHEVHHDCNLCDFNTEPLEETKIQFTKIEFHELYDFNIEYNSRFDSYSHTFFSLRAPPALG